MSSTGKIKKPLEKGFSFIAPDDGSEDVFVHVKECPELERCQVGDACNYDIKWNNSNGKYYATNFSLRRYFRRGSQEGRQDSNTASRRDSQKSGGQGTEDGGEDEGYPEPPSLVRSRTPLDDFMTAKSEQILPPKPWSKHMQIHLWVSNCAKLNDWENLDSLEDILVAAANSNIDRILQETGVRFTVEKVHRQLAFIFKMASQDVKLSTEAINHAFEIARELIQDATTSLEKQDEIEIPPQSNVDKLFHYVTRILSDVRPDETWDAIAERWNAHMRPEEVEDTFLTASRSLARSVDAGEISDEGIDFLLRLRISVIQQGANELDDSLLAVSCPVCHAKRPRSSKCNTCNDTHKIKCGTGVVACIHCRADPKIGRPRPLCEDCVLDTDTKPPAKEDQTKEDSMQTDLSLRQAISEVMFAFEAIKQDTAWKARLSEALQQCRTSRSVDDILKEAPHNWFDGDGKLAYFKESDLVILMKMLIKSKITADEDGTSQLARALGKFEEFHKLPNSSAAEEQAAMWSQPIPFGDDFWDSIRTALRRNEKDDDIIKTQTNREMTMEEFSNFPGDIQNLFPISVQVQESSPVSTLGELRATTRGRDSSNQNAPFRRADSTRSDSSSGTSHGRDPESARGGWGRGDSARGGRGKAKGRGNKPERCEWEWPGQSDKEDLGRWDTLRKKHESFHSLEDVTDSALKACDFLKELDGKGAILNMWGMRCAVEQIFMKSACLIASSTCFESAEYTVDMMRRHKCRFPVNAVTGIVKAISLRAEFASKVAPFVRRLVRQTLRHLSENKQEFLARHMVFALAERHEDFKEFLAGGDSRFEKGLQIDWDGQKLSLYNKFEESEDGTVVPQWYEVLKQNKIDFQNFCLLSLDREDGERTGFGHQYQRQVDGAIVQLQKPKTEEPLVAKLLTPVTVPFERGVRYRLYDMGLNNQSIDNLMEALIILGDAYDIEKQKAAVKQNAVPHQYLMDVLMIPPEEPFIARGIHLQPRLATLEEEIGCWLTPENQYDDEEGDTEPIRVRKIGTGAFLAWNQANPKKAIRVGDRIAKVNGAEGKEDILAELRLWHGFKNAKLDITFMRAVRARDHGIENEVLERVRQQEDDQEIEPTTEDVLQREYQRLVAKLNPSQLDALRVACTRRLALIQGPPGAGKTTTAVEIVCFLLENKLVPTPILISGQTHASVDNMLLGIAKRLEPYPNMVKRRVVRLGIENAKIHKECLPYLVSEQGHELEHADVICSTCNGSGNAKLQGIPCHTLLIDEGSQATESACLIPLCHGVQHLIIVGDQCQLEPMVKSGYAKSEQLGMSLFNRLFRQGFVPTLLNTQHRMHPSICEFPSAAFYGGELLTGVSISDRMPSKAWKWPSPTCPVCFVDVSDGCEVSTGDKIVNEVEAAKVQNAVLQLLKDADMKKKGDDGTYAIAVVTGYAAQKALIKQKLIDSGLGDEQDKDKCLVEVNTVDAFQGREKAVIIFSAVRANYKVGFLRDWRRLNVMLTRARNGLIIFGHRETLNLDYYWYHWLRWASECGCIMGEAATGKWKRKCLLPEEWTLKTGDNFDDKPAPTSKVEPKPITERPQEVELEREKTPEAWDSSPTASSALEGPSDTFDDKPVPIEEPRKEEKSRKIEKPKPTTEPKPLQDDMDDAW